MRTNAEGTGTELLAGAAIGSISAIGLALMIVPLRGDLTAARQVTRRISRRRSRRASRQS